MPAEAATDSLEATLSRCRAGDPEAFTRIYRRYGRRLYGTALRLLRHPEEAEDAMQEVFLRFYRKGAHLDADHLLPWLLRVTTNHCVDRIRRRGTRAEEPLEPVERTSGSLPGECGLDLRAAVQRLPERARLIFLLHDVEGLKHREIAEQLEISEGSSKSQLFRARELLRARLTSKSAEAP